MVCNNDKGSNLSPTQPGYAMFVTVHQDRLTRHVERLHTEAIRLDQLVP